MKTNASNGEHSKGYIAILKLGPGWQPGGIKT